MHMGPVEIILNHFFYGNMEKSEFYIFFDDNPRIYGGSIEFSDFDHFSYSLDMEYNSRGPENGKNKSPDSFEDPKL